MSNGLYACRSGGCDYTTKYNSNMWRHRRKYNHFLDTNDDSSATTVSDNVISIDIKEEPLEEIYVALDDIVVDEARLRNDSSSAKEAEAVFNHENEDVNVDDIVDDIVDDSAINIVDEVEEESEETGELDVENVEAMEVDSIEEKSEEAPTEESNEKTEIFKEKEDLNQSKGKLEAEKVTENTPPKPKSKITAYFLPVPKSVEKVSKVQTVDQDSAKKNLSEVDESVDCQSTEDDSAKSPSLESSSTIEIDD